MKHIEIKQVRDTTKNFLPKELWPYVIELGEKEACPVENFQKFLATGMPAVHMPVNFEGI